MRKLNLTGDDVRDLLEGARINVMVLDGEELLATADPLSTASPRPNPSDVDRGDLSPIAALAECYDLWVSGAWSEKNAAADLDEVMDHLGRLLNPVPDHD